jgi:hypothetical protein
MGLWMDALDLDKSFAGEQKPVKRRRLHFTQIAPRRHVKVCKYSVRHRGWRMSPSHLKIIALSLGMPRSRPLGSMYGPICTLGHMRECVGGQAFRWSVAQIHRQPFATLRRAYFVCRKIPPLGRAPGRPHFPTKMLLNQSRIFAPPPSLTLVITVNFDKRRTADPYPARVGNTPHRVRLMSPLSLKTLSIRGITGRSFAETSG